MEQLIVILEDGTDSALIAQHIQLLKGVESVTAANSEAYDWINPLRPATDEEIQKMVEECEADYQKHGGVTSEEALKKNPSFIKKKEKKWKKEVIR